MWPFRFAQPAVLLLLLPLAAAIVLWRRRLGGACAWAAIVCLVLALARPSWRTRTARVARVYVLDASGSMFLDASAARRAIRESMAALAPADRAGLVLFAREPVVALPLTEVRRLPAEFDWPSLPREGTALAEAIRLAGRQFPDGAAARQIVLITDGRSSTEGAGAEAALAAEAGADLLVLPLGPSGVRDARVVRVDAPPLVRLGEPFRIVVELSATAPIEALVTLSRDGEVLSESRAESLEAGTTRRLVLTDRLERPGLVTYRASLDLEDRCAENNTAAAVVQAEGAAEVLYLSQADEVRPLEQLLRRAEGLSVRRGRRRAVDEPRALLRGADCIVVDDVAAGDLPVSLQEAIRDAVRDTAAGLVVAGGRHSFGPGGYTDTPLEEALPVRCQRPEVALVVALDRSGSMGEGVKGRAKIAYAREAVLGALDRLREDDTFGLLAFAGTPQVVLPVAAPPSRERCGQALAMLDPHGPTELGAALEAALDIARRAGAEARCVILVSDGQAEALDAERLRGAYADAGVALAALMTGTEARAVERLRKLAGEYFHHVTELHELPVQLLDALREAVHGRYIREGEYAVERRGPLEVSEGVEPAGPLRGYVRTAAKDRAAVEWRTAKEGDPVLARWAFGLGRSVAFTSTVGTSWDARLWGERAGVLWRQAVRWAARPARTPGFDAEVTPDETGFRVRVRAEQDGRFVNGLDLRGRVVSPSGQASEVAFAQTAPGEYEAHLPAAERGAYRLAVFKPDGGLRLSLGMVKPYAREWAAFGVDRAAVQSLARQGRGQVIENLDALDDVPLREGVGRVGVGWVFLAAALMLFVVEVALGVLRRRALRL